MKDLYPWLEPQWRQLQARRQAGKLPHGLLFSGPAGVGKRGLAQALAHSLLCRTPDVRGLACGRCEACHLLQAGTHPDYLPVQPPEDKTQILIDQVRELCADLSLKSHAGGYKIASLVPAEALNNAAANSLLKTLEEPTDNSLLILVTEQPARLAATLRSRCQLIRFPIPETGMARDWLQSQEAEEPALQLRLADGAPLSARQLTKALREARHQWLQQLLALRKGELDPIGMAADWTGDTDLQPLDWLSSFVMDMIRLHTGIRDSVKNIDLLAVLERFSTLYTAHELHCRLERIWHAQRLVGTAGVNRQLILEELLIDWSPVAMPHRARA